MNDLHEAALKRWIRRIFHMCDCTPAFSVMGYTVFAMLAMVAGIVATIKLSRHEPVEAVVDFCLAAIALIVVGFVTAATDWEYEHRDRQASLERQAVAEADRKLQLGDMEFERGHHEAMAKLKAVVDDNAGAVDSLTRDQAQQNRVYLDAIHRGTVADLNAEFARCFPVHDIVALSGYETSESRRLLDSLGGDDSE